MLYARDFDGWARGVPREITDDLLWRMGAYRMALFIGDAAREDAAAVRDRRDVRAHADQLLESAASVAANVADGYGRSGGRDRARFFEYAICSAREARTWYFLCREALRPGVTDDRIETLSQIIRMLTSILTRERRTRLDRSAVPQRSVPSQ